MLKVLFVVWLLCFTSVQIKAAENFFIPPDKWREPIIFHTEFQDEYSKRFILKRYYGISSSITLGRALSTNEIYCADIITSDITSDSIYVTKIHIHTGKDYMLSIELIDHKPNLPEIRWVNEKLLFVRVWWGKVLGSDFIIDIEKEKIIYKDMINDGRIPFLQHQQNKDTASITDIRQNFNDSNEYFLVIQLARELLFKTSKKAEEYEIIEVKKNLIRGLNFWKITYKLKKLLTTTDNEIIGKGGEIFFEVNTKNKTAKLLGYGE